MRHRVGLIRRRKQPDETDTTRPLPRDDGPPRTSPPVVNVLRARPVTSPVSQARSESTPALIAGSGAERTVTAMPAPMFLSRPLRSHGVAVRPADGCVAPAKTISRIDPAVVVPAAADPAVLVTLGADLRLRLATLADDTGVDLGDLAVTRLATGCVELAPVDKVTPGVLKPLKVDAQRRLRLTAGIAARLGVTPGTKVLVTCHPDTGRVVLLHLGALADALDELLGDAADTAEVVAEQMRPVAR